MSLLALAKRRKCCAGQEKTNGGAAHQFSIGFKGKWWEHFPGKWWNRNISIYIYTYVLSLRNTCFFRNVQGKHVSCTIHMGHLGSGDMTIKQNNKQQQKQESQWCKRHPFQGKKWAILRVVTLLTGSGQAITRKSMAEERTQKCCPSSGADWDETPEPKIPMTREDRGFSGSPLAAPWQCGLDGSFRRTNEKDQEENDGEYVAALRSSKILGGPPSHVKAWSCWAPACAWFYCVASAPIFKVELKESDKATICLSVALVLNVGLALMLTCPSCEHIQGRVFGHGRSINKQGNICEIPNLVI